ncbi:transposase [Streptomyces sp. MNP-20]|uniref:transposase n=1 Tax=Streptomyces sp. MNP-20 TaxID=2721165 RepID=UPI0015544957
MGNEYTGRYFDEFKRNAIALVDPSGETVTAIVRKLGIGPESLRGWYRQAKDDRGEELKRLRRQNAEQARTIAVLRKPQSPSCPCRTTAAGQAH